MYPAPPPPPPALPRRDFARRAHAPAAQALTGVAWAPDWPLYLLGGMALLGAAGIAAIAAAASLDPRRAAR
jgi:hypothetical protein